MAECRDIEVYKPADLDSRLEKEKDTLEGYFWPEEFPILHKNDTPCFERKVEVKDKHYKLRVYVNSEYPRKMPDLVVCEPPESMPVDNPHFCGSHATHTWPPLHGFLHICHWHWAAWTRENMIFQVFNKGVEWLEAYEKYLIGKKLPLDLQQMKLTEEEELKAERVEKLQIALLGQEIALALYQSRPNFLNDLHNWQMRSIFSNILSQRNLPIFTVDEINNEQTQMIETFLRRCNMDNPIDIACGWLFALLCLFTKLNLANPGCTIDVSFTPFDDGRLHFRLVAVRPRSIKNN
ncbi:uncharacterized protein LOC114525708 [Dendronephthya gigantea]|uniref:uncharacterized protein LOC114525708 n=1 Tax=Dendronephthya gigantea TaxID=151771 RepID=UPI0010692826|nr:uncharacterized protein LOC114525708 [Dendronephthya gigantea]